jgi:heme/copper-type cytochrome/quinol oxidase subunit 3
MSATATADLAHKGLNPVAPHKIVRFGMFTFLASEVMLFAGLIGGYIVLRKSLGPNFVPTGAPELPVLQTAIASIFLISSSFTCIWGERRAVKGKRASWPLFITILLGAVFLANQAREWYHLYHEGLWFNTYGTYASTFFTITGFHGFHVFAGLVLLSITWVLSVLGKFDGHNINFFDCVALYWHFVDLVWIVVFTILYIPQFVPFLTT